MKVLISRTFILTLIALMCTYGAANEQSTIVGDIKISTLNGTIICDSLICPPRALACHVTKHNDPGNHSKIIRTRKCFAENGAVVAHESRIEPNTFDGSVNISVVSGGGDPDIVQKQKI